jgi:hypothetical protein
MKQRSKEHQEDAQDEMMQRVHVYQLNKAHVNVETPNRSTSNRSLLRYHYSAS